MREPSDLNMFICSFTEFAVCLEVKRECNINTKAINQKQNPQALEDFGLRIGEGEVGQTGGCKQKVPIHYKIGYGTSCYS